jgi:hypothetical protein
MTSAKFHTLARAIFACERAATDPVRQVYWAKHFVRLISLVRNSNLRGIA